MRSAGVLILNTQQRISLPSHAAGNDGHRYSRDPVTRLPFTDVLGRSVMLRMIDRLRAAGIEPIEVLAEIPEGLDAGNVGRLRQDIPFRVRPMIEQFAQRGAQLVVCLRLGPYADLDFGELLGFHFSKKASYTTVYHGSRKLPVFVADLVRPANTISALLDWLDACQIACARFSFSGYVNDLETLADLRRLAKDGLSRACQLDPIGKEVRPGVWFAEGVHVSSEARIVAPAFVGAHSVIRSGALVTRSSNIECHCEVDVGTAIEDSTLLPYTMAGPGLEIVKAIVDGPSFHDLRRHTHVQVEDRKILSNVAPNGTLDRIRAAVPSWLQGIGRAPTES